MGWGRGMPIGDDADSSEEVAELERMREISSMALSDGLGSVADVERLQKTLARNYEETERLIREDEAACSEKRTLVDGSTIWEYVIVAGEYARIIHCSTQDETLRIPDAIEDLPVAELAVDCCSYLDSAREVICSPQIEKIGNCAFRGCKNLERIVLPRNVDSYD